MGKVVRCEECGKGYRSLETLEDLRDNDGICLVCNAPIEVEDWDRVLASYEDDDFDDDHEDEEDEDDFGDDLDDDDLDDDFGDGFGELDEDGLESDDDEFLDDDDEDT